MAGSFLQLCVDPERPAVRGQLVDVEHLETVGGEHVPGGEEGEVGEVLVIDRVELVPLHQAHQMRELDRDHTLGSKDPLHAGGEVVQVGYVGEDVVRDEQVGLVALLCQA